MSHFGRSGPPYVSDTNSLLVLSIAFRTKTDDLYPLSTKYGKVVDVFIPRDLRGRVVEPPPSHEHQEAVVLEEATVHIDVVVLEKAAAPAGGPDMISLRERDYRERSISRSRSYKSRKRHNEEVREHCRRSMSHCASPDDKHRVKGRYDDYSRSPSRSLSCSSSSPSLPKASPSRLLSPGRKINDRSLSPGSFSPLEKTCSGSPYPEVGLVNRTMLYQKHVFLN
ncbi:unnamed protein product [Cochlearia groenlandica]